MRLQAAKCTPVRVEADRLQVSFSSPEDEARANVFAQRGGRGGGGGGGG